MEIELKRIEDKEEIREGDLVVNTYKYDKDENNINVTELYMIIKEPKDINEYYENRYALIDFEGNYEIVTKWYRDIYELIEKELGELGDIRIVKNNKLKLIEI